MIPVQVGLGTPVQLIRILFCLKKIIIQKRKKKSANTNLIGNISTNHAWKNTPKIPLFQWLKVDAVILSVNILRFGNIGSLYPLLCN